MHKTAEKTAEQIFSSALNSFLIEREWTATKLYMQANKIMQDDNTEAFSLRSLQGWLTGQRLPKIEPTVTMAKALGVPELISVRLELATRNLKKENPPVLYNRRIYDLN